MKLVDKSVNEFILLLKSKEPAPGGGAAAALSGAMGSSLAGMVINLTLGKKKYAAFKEDLLKYKKEIESITKAYLNFVDKDKECFVPLSKAYSLPDKTKKEKENKIKALNDSSILACSVPQETIKLGTKTLKILEELKSKGSKLALSDVAAGAENIAASVKCAWLNILINLNTITDQDKRKEFSDSLFFEAKEAIKKAKEISESVQKELDPKLLLTI